MTDIKTEGATLRYRDLSDLDFGVLTLAAEETRWLVLETMGIRRPDDETVGPLLAWRHAMEDENGVPRGGLYPMDLTFVDAALRRFVWFLA